MNEQTYLIYNASAGSGKTYTLVLEYLKLILKNPKDEKIRHILAITFTNKAANEMKGRILSSVIELAKSKESKYRNKLCEEFKISESELQKRAETVLIFILHHYSLFSVSTIDKYNFRLLRSFSKELDLPSKFSIEMNPNYFIEEAINEVTSKIGTNDDTGKLLLDYVLYQFNENEKRVNFRDELKKRVREFSSEKNYFATNSLKNKTLKDFETLKDSLKKKLIYNKNLMSEIIKKSLDLIEEYGLSKSDFKGRTRNGILAVLEKFYKIIQENQLHLKISPKILNVENCFENGQLYSNSSKYKSDVESITNDLKIQFKQIYTIYEKFLIDSQILYELINLETNSEVIKFLTKLKTEQEIVFIGDANTIINNNLASEPSNYIYEKIGSKYQHFFFDEFQDTSELQWENFLPLVENTINQKDHSVLLVGDVKQAIYRFKGGKPELLIQEINKIKYGEITTGKESNLLDNHRSFQNIVHFNNEIYTSYSKILFNENYKEIYKNAKQNLIGEKGGRVQIAYFDDKEYLESTNNHILKIIRDCEKNKISLKDIVILFRGKREAKKVTAFLIENEIPVLSEDSLFLDSILCIDIVLNFLYYIENHKDKAVLFKALYGLNLEKNNEHDLEFSAWFFKIKDFSTVELIQSINEYFEIDLNLSEKEHLNCYDFIENLIRCLELDKEYQTYFSSFLNVIFEFESSSAKSVSEFLEYWESESDTIKYKLPEKDNSVQIMTIHKSKGLEFPIVILPYFNSKDRTDHQWFKLNPQHNSGFETFYLKFNATIKPFIPSFKEQFNSHELENEIDELNVNYVATTRAVEQLYMIFPLLKPNKDKNKEERNQKTLNFQIKNKFDLKEGINELFPDFNSKNEIVLTDAKGQMQLNFDETSNSKPLNLPKFEWVSNSWNTKIHLSSRNENLLSNEISSKEYGNLIHDLLSKINFAEDFESIFKKALFQGIIPLEFKNEIYNSIYSVLNHPDLKTFYQKGIEVYNEREILINGELLRADRIVKIRENYTLIDYKTGKYHPSFINQINNYESVLNKMGKFVENKFIILIEKEIKIVAI